MRLLHVLTMATTAMALTAAMPAAADSWKDESGHGYGGYSYDDGERKQEWREGPCKYERKWEGNGEYKEEVKCDDHGHAYPAGPAGFVAVPAPPPVTIIVPLD